MAPARSPRPCWWDSTSFRVPSPLVSPHCPCLVQTFASNLSSRSHSYLIVYSFIFPTHPSSLSGAGPLSVSSLSFQVRAGSSCRWQGWTKYSGTPCFCVYTSKGYLIGSYSFLLSLTPESCYQSLSSITVLPMRSQYWCWRPLPDARLCSIPACLLSLRGSNENPFLAPLANEGQISTWSLSPIVICHWGISLDRLL